MPILSNSSFDPPWYLRQGDIQTLGRYLLFQSKTEARYQRERITTADGDFLDLDWIKCGSPRVLVISHGLEGSSDSSYIKGLSSAAILRGWDILAWNFRGCSGTPNRFKASYHSGKWDDLETVMQHIDGSTDYQEIALVGFSVGGNIVLRYLAQNIDLKRSKIISAATICAPVDLKSSAERMAETRNLLYMRWFLKLLKDKLYRQKIIELGSKEDLEYKNLKNFRDFDNLYTAPQFGFLNADDYWRKSSSLFELDQIKIPSLILNPKDDPMLGKTCYPIDECEASKTVFLETPDHGGHVGFVGDSRHGISWVEDRVLCFIEGNCLSGCWKIPR